MKRHALFSLLVAGSLAFGATSVLAQNTGKEAPKEQPKKETTPAKTEKDMKKDDKGAAQAKVGEKAPDFTLTDLDGKTVTLSELTKQKKIVVLEWFNPECPFSGEKQYKKTHTMADTAKAYKDKGVVWLAINSGANDKDSGGSPELNKEFRKANNVQYPILLDSTGKVGKQYGSKNTPTMYVIDTTGTLVYWGAIDNDRSADKAGDVNYVKKALDSVLKGETVTESYQKAYGCQVHYAADHAEHATKEEKKEGKKEEKKDKK